MTSIEEVAQELADAVEEFLPGWVEREVERIHVAWRGTLPDETRAAASAAGIDARNEVIPLLRALLGTDIDEQRTNPLSIVRGAVRFPTRVLLDAGVPAVVRDDFNEGAFPDDPYDLTPASFADVHPDLHEPGLRWGAAKAHVHLTRRRAEGLR